MDGRRRLPPATALVVCGCCTVAVASLVFGRDLRLWCLNARTVVHEGELWRLATAQWLHGGALHLLFNMLSLAGVGGQLETRTLGSARFLAVNVLLMAASALLYCGLAFLWASAELLLGGSAPSLPLVWRGMSTCAVGYSGVIFGLLVLRCHLSEQPQFSFLGLGRVPAAYYPWLSLAAAQLLMPSVSFLGHLSGCIAGYLYVCGAIRWAVPDSFVSFIDSSPALRKCRELPGYTPSPGSLLPHPRAAARPAPRNGPTSAVMGSGQQSGGVLKSLFDATPVTPGGIELPAAEGAATKQQGTTTKTTATPDVATSASTRFPGTGRSLAEPSRPKEPAGQVTQGPMGPGTYTSLPLK
mmetsp:Transcript_1861/g.6636  ORF Transcript_1861/g.6636 Transcript_1861/m.6636 type:complete len:355 (-) Transcript_1861:31-1095(-)